MTRMEHAPEGQKKDSTLRIDLGRAWLTADHLARIEPGCVIELDRPACSDMDVYADGKLVATGQAVAVDGCFGVRVKTAP